MIWNISSITNSSNINLSILMKMEYEISYSLIYSEIYEQQLCVNKLQYDWVASNVSDE